MKIHQLSLFLENRPGQLRVPCQMLGDAGIDILTMSLADTQQFGILRLIVEGLGSAPGRCWRRPGRWSRSPSSWPSTCRTRPGGLAEVLEAFEQAGLGIEYMYASGVRGPRQDRRAPLPRRGPRRRGRQAGRRPACRWSRPRSSSAGSRPEPPVERSVEPSSQALRPGRGAAARRAGRAPGGAAARRRWRRAARVPFYREAFAGRRRRPGGGARPRRPAPPALHGEGRPAAPLPAGPPGRAAGAGGARSTAPPAPPASRPSWPTPGATSTPGPAWWPASWSPAACAPATSPTSPSATASSPAASACTTASSGSGRRWSRPAAATPRGRSCSSATSGPTCSSARRATPSTSPRWPAPRASRPGTLPLRFGHFGGEPWTEEMRAGHRAGARHPGLQQLRPLRGDRPGRLRRVRRAARHARPGGPLPGRVPRPRDARAGAGRRGGRTRLHLAHQGGHAHHPLPDPRPRRPRPQPVPLRPHRRAHGPRGRPHRRHAHHPRRQRLPLAGRGGAAPRRGHGARTTSSRCRAPAPWTR